MIAHGPTAAGHGVHLALLAGCTLSFVAIVVVNDGREWARRHGVDVWIALGALASVGAGAVHLLVGPAHLGESVVSGVLLTAAGLVQVLWAVAAVRRPSRATFVGGLVANALLVSAWLVSRTTEAAWGPFGGREPVGPLDLLVVLLQLVVVGACSWALTRTRVAVHDSEHARSPAAVLPARERYRVDVGVGQ